MMRPTILGAVLAGGASSRFGSDKALASFRGAPMIDHSLALLRAFTDGVVIVGGERDGYPAIADLPAPGLGPLGGVGAALAHARVHGFDAVLTLPCDTPDLPREAVAALVDSGAPAFLDALPVAGLWLARDVGALLSHLSSGGSRSMRWWTKACAATPVTVDAAFANINRPDDLRAAERNTAERDGPPA